MDCSARQELLQKKLHKGDSELDAPRVCAGMIVRRVALRKAGCLFKRRNAASAPAQVRSDRPISSPGTTTLLNRASNRFRMGNVSHAPSPTAQTPGPQISTIHGCGPGATGKSCRFAAAAALLRTIHGARPAGALRATPFAPGESVDLLSSTPARPNCRAPCL